MLAVALLGDNIDNRAAARKGDPDAVRLDRERGTLVGDFQRSRSLRVADQHVGGAQAHGVQCARHGYPEALISPPPEVLQRGHQARELQP